MSDYNDYITAVNKIFDYITKVKAGWNNMDNMNYIENIEEYKDIVVSNAEKFKQPASAPIRKPESLDKGDGPQQPVESLSSEELKVDEQEENNGVADDSLEALGND